MNSPLQQFSSPSTSTTTSTAPAFTNLDEEQFYAVIDRLKAQRALPQDSFPKELPFFNIASVSKESQIKQLFEDTSDPNLYKNLIKNMISLPSADKSPELISKTLSAMQVMNFAQIMLFKVLPCPDENCSNQPREVAPGNQYKDYEYSCPFYHHDRDRRRLVITPNIEDEFTYKANYLIDNSKGDAEKEKHSLNYFESMFHPLYYKMFSCKRKYCNFSTFCPAFHSEEERKTWDNMFSNYIRKDRVAYVKDKQKYLGGSGKQQQQQSGGYNKAKSVTNSPNTYVGDFRCQTNKMNYHRLRNATTQMQVGVVGANKTTAANHAVENRGWRAETKPEAQSGNTWESNDKKQINNNNSNKQKKNVMQKLKNFEQFEPRDSIVERIC